MGDWWYGLVYEEEDSSIRCKECNCNYDVDDLTEISRENTSVQVGKKDEKKLKVLYECPAGHQFHFVYNA